MQVQLDKKSVKAMATKVRSFAQNSQSQCTQAQAYEFLAQLFNVRDWNTLSAMLTDAPSATPETAPEMVKALFLECGSDDPFVELPDYVRLAVTAPFVSRVKSAMATGAPISRIELDATIVSVSDESLMLDRELGRVELYCSNEQKWWLSFELVFTDVDGDTIHEYFTTPILPLESLEHLVNAPVTDDIVQTDRLSLVTWKQFGAIAINDDPVSFFDRIACYALDDDHYDAWQDVEVF